MYDAFIIIPYLCPVDYKLKTRHGEKIVLIAVT